MREGNSVKIGAKVEMGPTPGDSVVIIGAFEWRDVVPGRQSVSGVWLDADFCVSMWISTLRSGWTSWMRQAVEYESGYA